jgi:hypothetical protein
MKPGLLSILLLVFAYILSACGQNSISGPSKEPFVVEDQASLLAALQSEGATVETAETTTQDFFSVKGQIVRVNGTDIQVFEYENAEAMENDASQVAPDGGSIGTSMVTWMDAPHFYQAGKLIVLYLGNDQSIRDLLNKVLGPQFAGQ